MLGLLAGLLMMPNRAAASPPAAVPAAAPDPAAAAGLDVPAAAAAAVGTLQPSVAAGRDSTVTLLTGDRVTLWGGGGHATVAPAAGRSGVRFLSYGGVGHRYVVPEDAAHLVASGAVDGRLFDVAGLAAAGYDDARRADLPLIVSYAGGHAARLTANTGTRALPSIGGAAVREDKAQAGRFWAQAVRRGALSGGISRIWLDGPVQAGRDGAATEVGAPAVVAHRATGAVVGAGASTESAVIAGMESATAKGAAVVDLGVHAGATGWAGTASGARAATLAGNRADPVSLAVTHLSRTTGALFLVPSSNAGPSKAGPDAALATAVGDLGQPVQATTASVSLGTAPWPHAADRPLVRTVGYRNTGPAPVILDLSIAAHGPAGLTAAPGLLGVSPSRIAVPAGGQATATVTADARVDSPDGAYSGVLTASGGGSTVHTPVDVTKEAESYTLTVTHVDTDGRPTGDGQTTLANLTTGDVQHLSDPSGVVHARLPKGQYLLIGDIVHSGATGHRWTRIVQPTLDLSADTAVTVDARTARPVRLTVSRASARPALIDLGLWRYYGDGQAFTDSVTASDFSGLYAGPLGPQVTGAEMTAYLMSIWADPGPEGNFKNSSDIYQTLDRSPGQFFTGFSRAVTDSQLATVRTEHNAQVPGRQAGKALFGEADGVADTMSTLLPLSLPHLTTYHLEGGGVEWSGALGENRPGPDGIPVEVTAIGQGNYTYDAGKTYSIRWNAAVYGPMFDFPQHVGRIGDTLWFGIPMYSDQDWHRGGSLTDEGSTKLFQNGRLLAQSAANQLQATVAPGPSRFLVEKHVARPSYSTFSTRIDAAWTFSSDTAPATGVSLPIWVVRYEPVVDDYNRVQDSPVTEVPITLQAQLGSTPGTVRRLAVSVSGDEGRVWHEATVTPTGTSAYGPTYVARVRTPYGAKDISLRARMVDSDGNTVDQTIVSAYHLAPKGAPPPAPQPQPTQQPPVQPPSCMGAPTTPVLSSDHRVVTTVHNGCDIYGIFWLMRYQKHDETGWRSIDERWILPNSDNRIEWACQGSGTFTYKAVTWDPNMMGYYVSPPVDITC